MDVNTETGLMMSWELDEFEKMKTATTARATTIHTVPHMLDAQPFSHSPTADCFFQPCADDEIIPLVLVPVAADDLLPTPPPTHHMTPQPRPEAEVAVVPSVSVCSNDPSSDARSQTTNRPGKRKYTRRRASRLPTFSDHKKQRVKVKKKLRQLQQLLPNCNDKLVDKASILDEAIVYLRALQMQVVIERRVLKHMMSMAVNPMMMGNYMSFPMLGFPHNASYFL